MKPSPVLALFLGLLEPVAGYAYTGCLWRGVVFSFGSYGAALVFFFAGNVFPALSFGFFLPLAGRLFFAGDAYMKARRPAPKTSAGILGLVCIFFVCVFVRNGILKTARNVIADISHVESNAMAPALQPGDWVLVRITRNVKRRDILVFVPPERAEVKAPYYVKRLTASEGDEIQLKEGHATKVPTGSLFVLGDNSLKSYDSRHFGFIRRESVKGRVALVFFPLAHIRAFR